MLSLNTLLWMKSKIGVRLMIISNQVFKKFINDFYV